MSDDKRRNMAFAQREVLHDYMKKHLRVVGKGATPAETFVRWPDGVYDKTVAAIFNLTAQQVRIHRQENFGHIYGPRAERPSMVPPAPQLELEPTPAPPTSPPPVVSTLADDANALRVQLQVLRQVITEERTARQNLADEVAALKAAYHEQQAMLDFLTKPRSEAAE